MPRPGNDGAPPPTPQPKSSGGGGTGTNTASGGSNFEIIYHFLSQHFPPTVVAALMGNIQVESSFNPGAYNANEGAIGLAQWEGGRRSALEAFARQNGGSEYDLMTQLEFMVHELQGPYHNALVAAENAGSAGEAAAAIDGQYEISSGSSRQARMSAAESIIGSGFKDLGYTGTYTAASGGNAELLHPDATTYQSALGPLAGLLGAVPELKDLMGQAIAAGWSIDKFTNAVENSAWYRDHSQTAREMIALQQSDPAEYQRRINRQRDSITSMVDQMGVNLSSSQMSALALDDLIGGWDNQTLQRHIGAVANYGFGAGYTADNLRGNVAQAWQQVQQVYADYGVPISNAWAASHAKQLVSGQTTLDTYKQHAMMVAESMFPAYAKQIQGGMTVKQIADPFVQQMANLLEVNPDSLSISTPLIKKALQGTSVTKNGSTTTSVTPMWQFEQQVRQDPRWAYTQNAHQEAANMLMQLGQDWGFA